MPARLHACVNKTGSTLSCHPCYIRPVLSDLAQTVKRYAALQGVCSSCVVSNSLYNHTIKIITIGDPSKLETRTFYRDHILPRVPEQLRRGLDFESLYEVFGGKLAHWNDYITDYGKLFHRNVKLKYS